MENDNQLHQNNISEINFDSIVEEMLKDDTDSNFLMEINGEIFSLTNIKQYYEFPELLERDSSISDKKRAIYFLLVQSYIKNIELKASLEHQYQYVKKAPNKQAAFAETVMLSLLSGFITGAFIALVVVFIQTKM